jgi:ribosomal protein S18 acetylase RimI-like enzyme
VLFLVIEKVESNLMSELIRPILIRDFRKTDLFDVLDVAHLSFSKEFESTGFDADHIRKMVDQMFGIPGRILLGLSGMFGREPFKLFVAEVDKKVVGTTMITKQGKMAYISTVMVHPIFRRQGIARKLVESSLEYSQRKKTERAVLHVIPANLPAKGLYTKLGFKDFERIAHLIVKVDSVLSPEKIEGIEIDSFGKSHVNAVYDLVRSSEDPKHLDIFDFKKSDLRAAFLERIFRFSTRNRIVAMRNRRVIGYAEATCTTPEEAGRIANVYISPAMKGKGVEEMLINAGINEIKRMGTRKVVGVASMRKPELIAAMKELGFEKCLELDAMFLEFK